MSPLLRCSIFKIIFMRKHRRFEKVSTVNFTVQTYNMKLRDLMNLVSSDVDVEVKARKGMYGNGSAEHMIPRTMDISRFTHMASRPKSVESPTPPDEPPTPSV